MPKHAIRIPPRETGRRVRWTLEISAAAGEGVVSARKTSRKHTRPKRRLKNPSPMEAPPPPVAAAAHLPAPTVRTAPLVPTGWGIVVGGVVAVGAAVALIGYPSTRVTSVAGKTKPEVLAQPVDVPKKATSEPQPASRTMPPSAVASSPVSQANVEKTVEKRAEHTPVAPRKRSPSPDPVPPPPSVGAARLASPSGVEVASPEHISDARASAATSDDVSKAVSISGCLETTADESQFRLTDTQGVDAPKARSWRSGFLKRRSAAVKLVEFTNAAELRTHVGHRVVATGLLAGQELRVRSLRADGASCD